MALPLHHGTPPPTPQQLPVCSVDAIVCEVCHSGMDDSRMLLCDACDHGYHMYCVKPLLVSVPTGAWFCANCDVSRSNAASTFQLAQHQFMQYPETLTAFLSLNTTAAAFTEPSGNKVHRRKAGVRYSRPRRQQFQLPTPSAPARRLVQLASLASALATRHTRYTAELHYTSAARRSRNDARLEVVGGDGVQEMSQTNLALFLQFQHMLADGRCPPLLVVYDPVQGFIVQADAAIRDRTLLAEFVGEVMDMHELQTDEGARGSDSLMHLLHTARPQHDLVICPDRTGNIARFFSGINNSVASSRQGLNVRAARFAVNGEARVVLYAARHIVRGERLVFDYNGLYKDGYPTDHFVG